LNSGGARDKVALVLTRIKSWFGAALQRADKAGWRLAAEADEARDARRFAEAAELYAEALAVLPGETGLQVQRGHMLKEIGRLEEAEQAYRAASAARPADADLALQLGHLHKLAGGFAEADRFYRRASELMPDWPAPPVERAGLRSDGWSGAPQQRRLAEMRAAIEASGLFDAETYRRLNPDLDLRGLTALDHFLMIGARERRQPHPLFDTDHYFKTYPDVGRAALNPLDDFLLRWRDDPRDPNPFFDTALYLAENPDLRASGLDPLSHYVRIGAARGARPSRRFDPAFYVENGPDVLWSGLEPLEHYVLHGRRDGRRINAEEAKSGPFVPVTDAALLCLKPPRLGPEMAVFVAHAPDGRLKPHVAHYLDALRRQGIATVLIAATEGGVGSFAEPVDDLVDGLYLRDNLGYDFAAWAHVLRAEPGLCGAERLYLLNDSLFGPTNDADFATLLRRAREAPADLVGMTENFERGWHIQSFFLLLKAPALRSRAFADFMAGIVAYADKDDVIFEYECKLAARLRAAGIACATLFEAGGRDNATIFRWKVLLEAGFPFVKVGTIRDRIEGADSTGWRAALQSRGYDVGLVDRTLAAARAATIR
jgi:tetratricopeptide (TPR) repeat protein